MRLRQSVHVRSFEAKDASGARYIIDQFATFGVALHLNGASNGPVGVGFLQTRDGLHVDRVDKGRYQIFTSPHLSGLDLTSDDPNAP